MSTYASVLQRANVPSESTVSTSATKPAESSQQADTGADETLTRSPPLMPGETRLDRVNRLLETNALQITDELKGQLYLEYTIATREVEYYLYTEVKAKGQGFRESFEKYTITHWPVVAQYLANRTAPIVVPVEVQESLSVAIQARRKHLVWNKKASWGYRQSHKGAIILLERVSDVLEPHFAPCTENKPAIRGHLEGAMDELPTHKQDSTHDVGGDQTRVDENDPYIPSNIPTLDENPANHQSNELDELRTMLEELTLERDELRIKLDKVTIERDELRTKVHELRATAYHSMDTESDKSDGHREDRDGVAMAKPASNEHHPFAKHQNSICIITPWKPTTSSEVGDPRLLRGRAESSKLAGSRVTESMPDRSTIPTTKPEGRQNVIWTRPTSDNATIPAPSSIAIAVTRSLGCEVAVRTPEREQEGSRGKAVDLGASLLHGEETTIGQAEEPVKQKLSKHGMKKARRREKALAKSVANAPPDLKDNEVTIADHIGVEGAVPSTASCETTTTKQEGNECQGNVENDVEESTPRQSEEALAGDPEEIGDRKKSRNAMKKSRQKKNRAMAKSMVTDVPTVDSYDAELEAWRRDPEAFLSNLCPGDAPGEIKRFDPSRENTF